MYNDRKPEYDVLGVFFESGLSEQVAMGYKYINMWPALCGCLHGVGKVN